MQSSTWLSAAGPVPAAIAPRSHRDPASGRRGRHARLAELTDRADGTDDDVMAREMGRGQADGYQPGCGGSAASTDSNRGRGGTRRQ